MARFDGLAIALVLAFVGCTGRADLGGTTPADAGPLHGMEAGSPDGATEAGPPNGAPCVVPTTSNFYDYAFGYSCGTRPCPSGTYEIPSSYTDYSCGSESTSVICAKPYCPGRFACGSVVCANTEYCR